MDESGGGSEATVSSVPLGHAKLEISLASKSRCRGKRWSNGAGVYKGRSCCRHKLESHLGTDGI